MKVRQGDEKVSLGGALEKEPEEFSSSVCSSVNFIGDPPTKTYTNNQGLPWLKNAALLSKTTYPSPNPSNPTYTSPSYLLTPNVTIPQQPFSPQTSPRYSKDVPQSHRQHTSSLMHSMSMEDNLFDEPALNQASLSQTQPSGANGQTSPRPHPPSFPSSSPSPSSKQYSAIINMNSKNKQLKFVPYKSTHPDLLEKITQIISSGMKEIEKLFEEDHHNQNMRLLKKLQEKKLKKMKRKAERISAKEASDTHSAEPPLAGDDLAKALHAEEESLGEDTEVEDARETTVHPNQEEVPSAPAPNPESVSSTSGVQPLPSVQSDACMTGLEVGGSVYVDDRGSAGEEATSFGDKSNNEKLQYLNDMLKNNLMQAGGPPRESLAQAPTSRFNTTQETFELEEGFSLTSPQNLYSFHKLKLYDYAFLTYIENSSIYQSFLRDVRDSYWNHINKISSYFLSYEENFTRIKKREAALEQEVLRVKHESSTRISEMRREISLLEFNIEQVDEKRIAAEKQAKEAKDSEAQLKKAYDDLKKSCVTITSSLSRMEEEHRKYLSSESLRLTEIVHLRAQEQKLNEEIERLQQLNQHLEQVQATMLSAEAAAALDLKAEVMQQEMLKMERIHRQLIIRYSNLKSIVEDCIVKWSASTSPGSSAAAASLPQFNNFLREQVQIRIDSIKEKDLQDSTDEVQPSSDISLLDSFQKTIMKNDIDPSVIVSTLLDRIDTSSRFSSSNSSAYNGSLKQSTSNVRPMILGGDAKQKTLSCMFSSENPETNSLSVDTSKQEQFFSPWKHFDGYGYQDFIPKYLKFHGKIHNFYLAKKEVIMLIREIWLAYTTFQNCLDYQGKSTSSFFSSTTEELIEVHRQLQAMPQDSFVKLYHQVPKSKFTGVKMVGGQPQTEIDPILTHDLFLALSPNPSLSNFCVTYFREKLRRILEQQMNNPPNNLSASNLILPSSSVTTPVIELCYNFLDGIKRFYSFSDCKLFSYIFRDKLSHDVYFDQQNLIENLRSEVEKEIFVSKTSNFGAEDGNTGDLKLEQFLRLLRRLFPNKSEHSLSKLSKALLLDNQTGRYIKSSVVLAETSDGRTSNFLEQLKIQHINEIIVFEKHLIDVLEQFAENFNSEQEGHEEVADSYYDTRQKTSKNLIKSKIEATVEETIYNEENQQESNPADAPEEAGETTVVANNFPLLDFDATFSHTSRSSNAQKLTMTVGQLREALSHADPNKTRDEINQLLARGCVCDLESLLLMEAKRSPIRLGNFIVKLRKGILKKSLPQATKK